eukprot:g77570.t1
MLPHVLAYFLAVLLEEMSAMPPKKKPDNPLAEAPAEAPAEVPAEAPAEVPSDQKHQADAEGKRGNARSPINKLRGKRSKGKNVEKFREGKKCYVSFVDDVSKPNVIYDEADTNDVTRKEAISMICPGDADVYFVAVDEYKVCVFHSWSAVKLFYNNESPPLFTKFCEDKRKKSG